MEAFDFHWKVVCGVRRCKEQTERLTHPFCAQHHITPLQLRMLLMLHVEGAQSVSTLARNVYAAGANISAQAKRLHQQGYISRRRSQQDERQVLLSLTDRGSKLVRQFSVLCGQSYEQLAGRITPEDEDVILAGLNKLNEVFDEEPVAPQTTNTALKETFK